MSIETERQLNQRVIELRDEFVRWGKTFEARINEDDSGWLYDAAEKFIERTKRMKETGL